MDIDNLTAAIVEEAAFQVRRAVEPKTDLLADPRGTFNRQWARDYGRFRRAMSELRPESPYAH